MPVRVVFRRLLRRREMDSGQACERQGPPQLREDRTAQGGWALFAVIALLGVLAVVAGALLRLAPSSLRLSLTQLDRVAAFDYAESGIHYALAWLREGRFNPSRPQESLATLVTEHAFTETGGFCALEVVPQANDVFTVAVTGYQRRGNRTQVYRTALDIRFPEFETVPLFHTHWIRTAIEKDYQWFPISWESWDRSTASPGTFPSYSRRCANAATRTRDIDHETCLWPGEYTLDWDSDGAKIAGSNVRFGRFSLGGDWSLTVSDSTIYVDGDFVISQGTASFKNVTLFVGGKFDVGGSSVATFENVTVYVRDTLAIGGAGTAQFVNAMLHSGSDAAIGGSGAIRLAGGSSLWINGDLKINGDGDFLVFEDGVTAYIDGDVTISGSGMIAGTGEPDAPWNVFYVRGGLDISGGALAGANPPDVVFLFDTDPRYSDRPIVMSGSGKLYGGIYAPTRIYNGTNLGGAEVHGSIIASNIYIPDWYGEEPFRRRFEAVEERMKTFHLGIGRRYDGPMELLGWREVRAWSPVPGCPPDSL
ncbi:MAG: hypothetical protein CW345_08040 [Firmicutes bacterium]|nr:hypothetical protein [Bacillota bacterium]